MKEDRSLPINGVMARQPTHLRSPVHLFNFGVAIMDAFETIVSGILQREGFWNRTSVKVDLTKTEKQQIGRPSSPPCELDVVGYRGLENELRVVECKSLLNSPGAPCAAFDGSQPDLGKRYKLFCDAKLWRIVRRRLVQQLVAGGFCNKRPRVKLCLAAGKIKGNGEWLEKYFHRRGWILYTPDFIREELRALQGSGYENSVATIVTKLLLRHGT